MVGAQKNPTCQGDFYELDNRVWYRCRWDGRVVEINVDRVRCPLCNRPIESHRVARPPVERRLIQEVRLDGVDGWVRHSERIWLSH